MMTPQELLDWIDELMQKRIPVVDGGRDLKTGIDCEGWIRLIYERQGIILPPRIDDARHDFEMIKPPLHFMDVGVLRGEIGLTQKRHLILMITPTVFTHCAATTGIAKHNISRQPFASSIMHFVRYKYFIFESGNHVSENR